MDITGSFICRSFCYSTLDQPVAAPLMRCTFMVTDPVVHATLLIGSPGFYEVHINGADITKGLLAPYRSNPDHYVYFDEYDITASLVQGENVLACILGNGLQNPVGAWPWKFDKARWRGAPCVSFTLTLSFSDGRTETIVSDETVKTADSAILFDDLHIGEKYDARCESPGWDMVGFDDTKWDTACIAPFPRGEYRHCTVEPIRARGTLCPMNIFPCKDGYIYDFGENNTGLCRLTISGEAGQEITLRYCETLVNGEPYYDNIRFENYQTDRYICRGGGEESHMPRFTYHGFRYVYVTGINPSQATDRLLTFVLFSSAIKVNGTFRCDNEVINRLQEATLRSDISNFHYFPTDCPHREKNGWTADISLSAEQLLLNFNPETGLREWLHNVYKAIRDNGQLPGIIPTAGWGYHWGNGPAWDGVLVNVPYYIYLYKGDRTVLEEAATPLMRYLTYLYGRLDENDLMCIGLGDWCEAGTPREDAFTTPLIVTDSILTVDIAEKSAFIFRELQMREQADYAQALANRVRTAFRRRLIYDGERVEGNTQTAQAMALYYGMFTEDEFSRAFEYLLTLIHEKDDHIATGVLGARVMFRLLADNNYTDLALHMMIRPDFPSFGDWIRRGATTLWEGFWREDDPRQLSMNHHFWGDISAWFYTYLAGLRVNPSHRNVREIIIAPCFVSDVNNVTASYRLPDGEVLISWVRTDETILLSVTIPPAVNATLRLPEGWTTGAGETQRILKTGMYHLKRS